MGLNGILASMNNVLLDVVVPERYNKARLADFGVSSDSRPL